MTKTLFLQKLKTLGYHILSKRIAEENFYKNHFITFERNDSDCYYWEQIRLEPTMQKIQIVTSNGGTIDLNKEEKSLFSLVLNELKKIAY